MTLPARLKPWGLGALATALGGLGLGLLWTTFMGYDDEGYVLYSLEAYARDGGLYDQVYSQYGPFYFVLLRALAALGLEFTNLFARWFALTCWLVSTAGCARWVWRASDRNFLATAATLGLTFLHLLPMTSEPSHPGGLIVALLALAANWDLAPRLTGARALAVGAVAAMLVLTKVNVGAFFIAAVLLLLLLSAPSLGARQRAVAVSFWAVTAAVVLRPSLAEASWGFFLLVLVAALLAVSLVMEPRSPSREPGAAASFLGWGAAGFGLVAVVTFAIVLATGSSVSGLAEGILFGPLRHPDVFSLPFLWKPGTLGVTALSLALAVIVTRQPIARRAALVRPAQFAVVAGYLLAVGGVFPFTQLGFTLSYGVVTAWIFVVRIREADGTQPARLWLALLLITQVLHAYPVAGSQVSWGTFLWVPLAVLGVIDALPTLALRWVRVALAGTLGLATLGSLTQHAWIAHARWRDGDRLGLPGADTLRLPESHANALRTMAANVRHHGDVLFSAPGLLSFHRWTGVPPPITANATHWFNLLSPEQQGRIAGSLAAARHPVLVVQRYVMDQLKADGHLRPNLLLAALQRDYVRRFTLGSYELWTRREQPIAAVGTATLAHGGAGAATRYGIEVILTTEAAAETAQLEVRRFRGDGSDPVAVWSAANAVFARVPVDTAGRDLPQDAGDSAFTRLMIFTNALPEGFSPETGMIYVRNTAGERIAEARFIR